MILENRFDTTNVGWIERSRQNRCRRSKSQRYINVCTTFIITRTKHHVRRRHTGLCALPGGLRGGFLLKITSLSSGFLNQVRTARRTFYLAKSTQKSRHFSCQKTTPNGTKFHLDGGTFSTTKVPKQSPVSTTRTKVY